MLDIVHCPLFIARCLLFIVQCLRDVQYRLHYSGRFMARNYVKYCVVCEVYAVCTTIFDLLHGNCVGHG
jgi:hypothetical protein